MGHRLRRTPEYKRARADLRFSARLLLPVLERRIADNPATPPPRGREDWFRFEVLLAGRVVTVERDPSELVIFFRVVAPDEVWLDLVVDLRDPPGWFLQPVGEWSEGLVQPPRSELN